MKQDLLCNFEEIIICTVDKKGHVCECMQKYSKESEQPLSYTKKLPKI